jgi:hypothetical protein
MDQSLVKHVAGGKSSDALACAIGGDRRCKIAVEPQACLPAYTAATVRDRDAVLVMCSRRICAAGSRSGLA